MAATVRAQLASTQQRENQVANLARKLSGGPEIDPILTTAIIAAIIGGVGVTVAAAGVAATAASAGTSVASMAMQGEATNLSAMEINVHNDTAAPLVNVSYTNGGCSVASSCRPLLPGGSTSVEIMQPGGFDSSSYITLTFIIGGGTYEKDGTRSIIDSVEAVLTLQYESDDWDPAYAIDDNDIYYSDDNAQGLTALYFEPTPELNILPFTLASYKVQKSQASIDVLFLPAAATLSEA